MLQCPKDAAVGGVVVPVDKFGLLAPYTGLASTILVATVASAYHSLEIPVIATDFITKKYIRLCGVK